MQEPQDNRESERSVTSGAPDRTDTNEKADDIATVTQPGGEEEVPTAETDGGRSVSPQPERGAQSQ